MKTQIKSLFEQFINKFSASYINYRKQNYPNAWTIKSIFYAEDFEHQHIKLLLEETKFKSYTLVFEHEGSIYTANDNAPNARDAAVLALALDDIVYWHKNNYLFKLSSADFEIALNSAKDYEEFILMCERMNNDEPYKASFYGSLKALLKEAATK